VRKLARMRRRCALDAETASRQELQHGSCGGSNSTPKKRVVKPNFRSRSLSSPPLVKACTILRWHSQLPELKWKFADRYQKLKSDFNSAMSQLHDAMGAIVASLREVSRRGAGRPSRRP